MFEQLQQLFGEIDATVTHLQDTVTVYRQMHSELADEYYRTQASLGSLQSDFKGQLADIFFTKQHELAVQSRLALRQLDGQAEQMGQWTQELQQKRTQYHPHIAGALWDGNVPQMAWQFMDGHYSIPTLAEITTSGSSHQSHPLTVWDSLVPTPPPHHDGGIQGFIEGLGDGIHSTVANLLTNLSAIGADIGMVRNAIGAWGDHLFTLFDDFQLTSHRYLAAASVCPCCAKSSPPSPPKYTPPPYPPTTTHTKSQLDSLATKINNDITNPGSYAQNNKDILNRLLNDLAGLSSSDIQALENIYWQKYHKSLPHALLDDSWDNLTTPGAAYQFSQILDPTAVTTLNTAYSVPGKAPRFIMTPPMGEAVTNATNLNISFDIGNHKGNPHYQGWIVGPDGKVLPGQTVGGDVTNMSGNFPNPGQYKVVYEVWYGDFGPGQSQPPVHYYSYDITAKPPAQCALDQLMNNTQTPYTPQLYEYLLQQTLLQSKAAKNQKLIDFTQKQIANANQYLPAPPAPPAIPIRSLYLDAASSTPVPMVTYLVPTKDGKWQIVDLTNPDKPGHYDAATTVDGAWQNFMSQNRYPDGHIVAIPPQKPANYPFNFTAPTQPWNVHNTSKDPAQTLAQWLGIGSTGLFLIWLGLQFVPGLDVGIDVGGIALGGSILLGGIAAGADLYDLWQHSKIDPNDPETKMDLLAMAGTLSLGLGEGAALVGDSYKVTQLAGAGAVAITFGQASFAASGIILAQSYMDQITAIQNTPDGQMSPASKQQAINSVLSSALESGALIFIGGTSGDLMKGVPPYRDNWISVADSFTAKLQLDPALEESIDPSVKQALLTYLGFTSYDGKDPATIDLNKLPPKQIAQAKADLQTLWNQYQADGQSNQTFSQFILDDRPISPDGKVGLSRFETLRINETVTAAKGNPKYDPTLLTALQDGQNLQLDASGKPVVIGGSTQVQAAFISSGYNLDLMQSSWENYKAKNTKGQPTADTFADALRQIRTPISLSTTLGGTNQLPLSTAFPGWKGFTDAQKKTILLGMTEPNLIEAYSNAALSTDPATNARLHNLIDGVLNNLQLPATTTGDDVTVGNAHDAMVAQFNQQLGQALASEYAQNPQIALQDFQTIAAWEKQGGNIGSMGEWFTFSVLNSRNPGSVAQHPTYTVTQTDIDAILQQYPALKNNATIMKNLKPGVIYPDLGTPQLTGVDVKTGYADGGIDEAQLLKYAEMIKKGERLQGLNYLFLPSDTAPGASLQGATAALDKVILYGLNNATPPIKVYYIDNSGNVFWLDPSTEPPTARPSSLSNVLPPAKG